MSVASGTAVGAPAVGAPAVGARGVVKGGRSDENKLSGYRGAGSVMGWSSDSVSGAPDPPKQSTAADAVVDALRPVRGSKGMHASSGTVGCGAVLGLSSSWKGDTTNVEAVDVPEGSSAAVGASAAAVAPAARVDWACACKPRRASLGSTTVCISVTELGGADARVAPELAWRGSVSVIGIFSVHEGVICRPEDV